MAGINSTSETEDNSEYKEHAKKYTNFLEEYKNYTKNSNDLKDKYKDNFLDNYCYPLYFSFAEYLFNKEEDSSMVKIIEQIQQYDRNMYALEKDVERKLMENSESEPDLISGESLNIIPDNPGDINGFNVHNTGV